MYVRRKGLGSISLNVFPGRVSTLLSQFDDNTGRWCSQATHSSTDLPCTKMLAARHHVWMRRLPRALHVLKRPTSRLTPPLASLPALSTSASSSLPERAATGHEKGLIPVSSHDSAPAAPGRRVYSREENLSDARRVAWEVLKIKKLSAQQEDTILRLLGGTNTLLIWPSELYESSFVPAHWYFVR